MVEKRWPRYGALEIECLTSVTVVLVCRAWLGKVDRFNFLVLLYARDKYRGIRR